jgi:NDP-sugar pyrophosphorylase family protein
MNVVIPMAGLGSRFPRDQYLPKPLIDVNGRPMIIRVIESLGVDGRYHFIIRKDEYATILRDLLSRYLDGPRFIEISQVTDGPASSALLFKAQINNGNELVVANCDQIMAWNSELFFHNVRLYDGAVVTYHSDTEKNSYAKLDKRGLVLEIREKEVVSNVSLNGIHYWKRGADFVKSAEKMIAADDRASNGEFYVGPSYNYLISEGYAIGIYHIPNEQHHAVGVPFDLAKFLKYDKI